MMDENQKKAYIAKYKDHCILVLAGIGKIKLKKTYTADGFMDLFLENTGEYVGSLVEGAYLQGQNKPIDSGESV